MQFWNNIIHTALLGTDKKQIAPAELAPALSVVAEQVIQQPLSKEDQFLQIAAVAFNYRQAGVMPLNKEEVTISKAATEEKLYCSAKAIQVLKDILTEESLPLLKLWLRVCQSKQQLLTPDVLPALLQLATTQKALQPYMIDCGGKRAAWLGQFNADWKFSAAGSKEEIWQTGTAEQRRLVLQQVRKEDPAKALEWIQQTWAQEDAGTKTDFIKALADGLSENDIPFLESLAAEKSKKVKDEALALLKKIPTSSIVQQYWHVLKQMLQLKKEKAMLGMINKTSLEVSAASMDDSIFKTGIDKLSNNREFTDDEHIIYQLLQQVPPTCLEEQWQLKPDEIINLFQKDVAGKKLLPALVLSVVNFYDERWAISFIQHSSVFYTDIIPLLPVQQQELYSIKFFTGQPESIISHAVKRETEWSRELTGLIFRQVAKNPYQYNRSFFNQHIHLIPSAIAMELERHTPVEESSRAMWSNTSDYILKLLSLKTQTINAFNI